MQQESFLNIYNIERCESRVEYHPLIPFTPADARILFLGSFPPQRKRWCMDFYYPNFINDHWRIEGAVYYDDKDYFVIKDKKTFDLPRIVNHCKAKGLAFYDTATAVKRLKDNASDKYLEVVEPTDVRALVKQMSNLRIIVTTGEKATETLCAYYNVTQIPKIGQSVPLEGELSLWRLPSSSRAYPLSFDRKVEAYKACMLSLDK